MKKIQMVFIGIFMLFIVIVGFCTLGNDLKTNPDEMRTYTRFPKLESAKDLLNDKFLKQIDDAYSDQLEWRSFFVKSYYDMQVNKLNMSYVGTVVIGKDQVLFNPPVKISNWKKYKKNVEEGAKLINDVAEQAKQYGTRLIVIDVPRRDIALPKYLPSYYPWAGEGYDECVQLQREKLSDDIEVIDVKSVFEDNNPSGDNKYWYYNDHHINAVGSDLILSEIMKIVNKDYPQVKQKRLTDYKAEYTQVYGALNRKIGLSAKAPDEILWLEPEGWTVNYTRKDNGKDTKKGFLNKKLDRNKRTYSSTYMGNNYGETIVNTDNDDTLPSIFYCGSSFTNALESMSVPSFKNMYSVDFRYNTTDNDIVDYIKKWKPEYTVLISAQSTATFNLKHLKTHLGYNRTDIDYD